MLLTIGMNWMNLMNEGNVKSGDDEAGKGTKRIRHSYSKSLLIWLFSESNAEDKIR